MGNDPHGRVLPVGEGYDAWAATYDAMANPTRDASLAQVRAWADRIAGRSVLELGCGAGLNTVCAPRLLSLEFARP